MSSKKLLILGVLFASMAFIACENGQEPNANNTQPTILAEVPQEVAINEAKNIAAFAVNFSNDFAADFIELKATEDGFAKVTNPDKIYRWNPETMLHTWTHTIEGENLSGYRFRAQQHLDETGAVIKKAQDAAGFTLYYISEGSYGFPDGSPSGTTWKHTIGSEETHIVGMVLGNSFVMNATGSYHKIWTGYYKANEEDEYELVTIDNGVDVTLDQLTITRDVDGNETASLVGNIEVVFADWNVSLSSDGGEMVTGNISKKGVLLQNLAFPVADLLEMGKTLLP
ncbi:MAG: hypothetical protein D8M58_01595 [Calditrichaeota bacterium]|nr:MAG: hypothetical protein DWQ03_05485 [Calditrichota bacterium]MBL1204063.1 hypothetical protein [Calditrichota bacterium]NOG43894.1 hypothetical protein [Calditrichota bacterium]